MWLYAELKRRNVLRVAAAYAVVAWLLIQVAETVFPLFGYDDTPARIVVVVLTIGFAPSVILAWVFELTPEGIRRERDLDSGEARSTTGLDRTIIVALVLALGYFAVDKFVLSERRVAAVAESARQEGRSEALKASYGDKSVAVLPFVNLSGDPEQEYFSDGISEEVMGLLARVPGLRVISRSSAFSFKGRDARAAEVAGELDVAHVLEGSVRRAGERVRIAVRLIEARSDTQIWSSTYDRTLDDIFAIQNEIAEAVVAELEVLLLRPAPLAEVTDSEAYALYLQSRQLGRRLTPEDLETSNALLEQALAIDEDYASAWDALAVNYIRQANFSLIPQDEGFGLARAAAERALAIAPDHAGAHATLGWIAMVYDGDLAASAGHFERALALDPNNFLIIGNAAALVRTLGRLEHAIELLIAALARDPLDPVAHANLASVYLAAGRWEEAIAAYRSALRLSPGYISAHGGVGAALLMQGNAAAALEEFEREGGDETYRLKGRAMALHALGRQAEFRAALDELVTHAGQEWPPAVAQVHAFAGDANAAFQWLDRAVESGAGSLRSEFLRPFYRPVYEDGRWAAFLERVGSAPAQLDAIPFEVAIPP